MCLTHSIHSFNHYLPSSALSRLCPWGPNGWGFLLILLSPPHSTPQRVGLQGNQKFHIARRFSTNREKCAPQSPAAQAACLLHADGVYAFLPVRIICADKYAGGAEAENPGTAAEPVSTQHLGNFAELQAAKETSGPQGMK